MRAWLVERAVYASKHEPLTAQARFAPNRISPCVARPAPAASCRRRAGLLRRGPALAAFNVCNKTNLPVRAAIGRFDGTNWTSEGWWTVQPKACVRLLTGPLQGRYYYLYASDGAAGTWEGKTHFCVAPRQALPVGGPRRLRQARLRPARLF